MCHQQMINLCQQIIIVTSTFDESNQPNFSKWFILHQSNKHYSLSWSYNHCIIRHNDTVTRLPSAMAVVSPRPCDTDTLPCHHSLSPDTAVVSSGVSLSSHSSHSLLQQSPGGSMIAYGSNLMLWDSCNYGCYLIVHCYL